MDIVVLGAPSSWYLRDLERAAAGRHRIISAPFTGIRAEAGPQRECFMAADVDLGRADAVIVRTMPPGSLEQVVFRMDVLARLEATGVTVINPPRAIEAAVDKYLATARLRAAGLPVPRTAVCQTAAEARQLCVDLGNDVVVKPLFGAEGRGIARLTDPALAERTFKLLEQLGAILYLQEYIDHEGFDLRVLVIGDQVLGMRRRNPLDWRTNISRGATPEAFTPDDSLADLARRAADAVGAPLAGVDILPGRDGELYVIEVNAVPGWKALASATGVDVARQVLELVESRATRSTA